MPNSYSATKSFDKFPTTLNCGLISGTNETPRARCVDNSRFIIPVFIFLSILIWYAAVGKSPYSPNRTMYNICIYMFYFIREILQGHSALMLRRHNLDNPKHFATKNNKKKRRRKF